MLVVWRWLEYDLIILFMGGIKRDAKSAEELLPQQVKA